MLCDKQFSFITSCRHLNAAYKEEGTDNAPDSIKGELDFPPKKCSYSCIHMNGKVVFKFAIQNVPKSIESALQKAGLSASSIDWLLLHQVCIFW